jgi:hypothetical protein
VYNPTLDDVLDWLNSREGESAYVEIGIKDPTLDDHDFYPLTMHVTLGKFDLGSDEGHDRGLVYLPFGGGDRNRIYLDPARATKIVVRDDAIKITFHDSIYVAMSGAA